MTLHPVAQKYWHGEGASREHLARIASLQSYRLRRPVRRGLPAKELQFILRAFADLVAGELAGNML
jgi:hypothetical protein